jgi:Arc/MetJ-type ribon-helix-helix transcriptional regulator
MVMKSERKITVHVGRELLAKAQRAARAGVSETVRKGLELLAASEAYDRLLKMRGKVKFSVDLRELREDRR